MITMPHWPKPYGKKIIDLRLERIKAILKNLGNPHNKLPPVIHVAGTNGKGSTIAFLKSILEASGLKVHVYTSPHIYRFNERIILAGQEINDSYLYELCEETRIATKDLQVTFFEGTTAVAFLAFSRVDADVVLIETGLGGRLDATNIIDNPIATIITPISYDHMEYLGTTLLEIANEKAGIIKRDSPCIISWQVNEVKAFLKKKCSEINSQPFVCTEDWHFEKSDEGFSYFDKVKIELPNPSLVGIHQIINASTAIATLQAQKHFKIAEQNIIYGITQAVWPARMQQIKSGRLYSMLPESCELWVDGAHNPAGAEMLAATLSTLEPKVTFMINGRTQNRDIESFLIYFTNSIKKLYCVPVQSEPLSEKPEVIHEVAKKLGIKSTICSSLLDGISCCIDNEKKPFRIIVCGSLYLASDLLAIN